MFESNITPYILPFGSNHGQQRITISNNFCPVRNLSMGLIDVSPQQSWVEVQNVFNWNVCSSCLSSYPGIRSNRSDITHSNACFLSYMTDYLFFCLISSGLVIFLFLECTLYSTDQSLCLSSPESHQLEGGFHYSEQQLSTCMHVPEMQWKCCIQSKTTRRHDCRTNWWWGESGICGEWWFHETSWYNMTLGPNQRRTSYLATISIMSFKPRLAMTVTATQVAINMLTLYSNGYWKMCQL